MLRWVVECLIGIVMQLCTKLYTSLACTDVDITSIIVDSWNLSRIWYWWRYWNNPDHCYCTVTAPSLTNLQATAPVRKPPYVTLIERNRLVECTLTEATKKGRPDQNPFSCNEMAKNLRSIGSAHILPTISTNWAIAKVRARTSSFVQIVTSERTATRVP